jgi:hypothetical protein
MDCQSAASPLNQVDVEDKPPCVSFMFLECLGNSQFQTLAWRATLALAIRFNPEQPGKYGRSWPGRMLRMATGAVAFGETEHVVDLRGGLLVGLVGYGDRRRLEHQVTWAMSRSAA